MRSVLRLAPLPVYYFAFILAVGPDDFSGDQTFYIDYTARLAELFGGGGVELGLDTGPGYPLSLLPLHALGAPHAAWRLLNVAWLFGAVLYVHATLRLYLTPRAALGFAYAFGLYPPLLKESFTILSECFAMFLMCGFVFHYCRVQQDASRRGLHRALAGVFAGWLILTKVFYSYVFVIMILAGGALWLVRRTRAAGELAVVGAGALALCIPYLAYTYSLTGRAFYWASTGGEALYWMSTPYPGEYGEWHPHDFRGIERLRANHAQVFADLPESRREADVVLRRKALENIRAHPERYAVNVLANMGRLVFSYPFSYRLQTPLTFLLILPNAFVFVLTVLCVYPSVKARDRIPPEIGMLLLFAAVSFGGTSLLAAYERQFRPLVPILGLWIAFVLTRVLRIEFRNPTDA